MSHAFARPRRQSPWSVILYTGKYAWQVFRPMWPILFVVLVKPNPWKFLMAGALFAGLVLLIGLRAWLNFRYYRFSIQEGNLIIREGWLRRHVHTIPLERIQTVNLEQEMVHRLTGTVRVQVETAGSADTEVRIAALGYEDARAFRREVFGERQMQEVGAAAEADPAEDDPAEETLVALGPLDLFKIGLSQNHFRTIVVVLALMLNWLDDVQPYLSRVNEEDLDVFSSAMLSLVALTVLALVLLVGVVLASVVRIMVRYADLVLHYDGHRFRMNSGLLTIREVLVRDRKLQTLHWSQHPLQRLFGLYHLEFRQAAAGELKEQDSVMLPGLYAPSLAQIHERVFRDESREGCGSMAPDRRYALVRWFWRGWVISGGLLLLGYIQEVSLWLPALMWWLWAGWSGRQYVWRWRACLSEDILFIREGWLARSWTVIPLYKVQSLTWGQSPLQRRLGVCTLHLHMAGDAPSLPWLPVEEARRLRDWTLYRVERDNRPWM